MKARVTVCLCAYNHEAYIRDALDRLAEQTFKDFKVIACDDGSTDATYDILKEYESGKLAGKLTVLTHPGRVNLGIHHSVNLCLNSMNTEYFMMHASDDFLESDALEYLLGLLENDTSADFLYGQVNVVDEQGADLFRFDGTEDIGSGLPAAERLIFSNPIRAPSMFFRGMCKEYLLSVPHHLVFGDWYHNVLLFLEKRPHYYRRPVVNYRVHSSNVSVGVEADIVLKRHLEVASALYANESVIRHPPLKLNLLLFLVAYDCLTSSIDSLNEEVKSALANVATQAKRETWIIKAWRMCEGGSIEASSRLLEMLPYSDGVRLLLCVGSVTACGKTQQMVTSAPCLQKVRLISQLVASLVLRACISVRDCWRCILAGFRGCP